MRRPYSRLAAACALVAAMICTGTAVAGGNPDAPGQQKKAATTAQSQQQSSAQVTATTDSTESTSDTESTDSTQSSTAHAQVSASSHASANSHASADSHASARSHASVGSQASVRSHASATAGISSTQNGVKPSSTTTHWTHCMTGSTTSPVTCTPNDNGHTPASTSGDASKRYGNGKTAAQIVASRGGVNVQITGPGNSQPHKVAACGHKSNPSGGVDVHAVKNYSTTACTQTPTQTAVPPTAPCGFVVVATTTASKLHGHGSGLSHNNHVTSSTTYSLRPDSTQSCGSAAVTTTTTLAATTKVQSTTTAGTTTQAATTTGTTTQAVTTTGTTTQSLSGSSVAGGVLGAAATKTSPKPAASHGVLGTVTNVGGSTLPFTGFPVWLAALVALVLILGGLAIRRRGTASQL